MVGLNRDDGKRLPFLVYRKVDRIVSIAVDELKSMEFFDLEDAAFDFGSRRSRTASTSGAVSLEEQW
jgi:hypothetical protein